MHSVDVSSLDVVSASGQSPLSRHEPSYPVASLRSAARTTKSFPATPTTEPPFQSYGEKRLGACVPALALLRIMVKLCDFWRETDCITSIN